MPVEHEPSARLGELVARHQESYGREHELADQVDALTSRVAALEAVIAGLQQWRLNVPFPAAPAAGCWPPPQFVYPGTAMPPMTVHFPTNVCAAAPLPGMTYTVVIP